jgi:amidase
MIILGKASLTEFCGLRAEGMVAGYSATNGQTQSPYIEGGRKANDGIAGHTGTGGSSSGSAVAVAAGLAPLSVGTETVGSIVLPANRAALYALRLTPASVDVEGVFQLARRWDTMGPMAKTPRDLAPLIEAMITPEAQKKLPKGGLSGAMTGKWDDLRLGFVDFDKWLPLGQFDASTKDEVDQMVGLVSSSSRKLTESRGKNITKRWRGCRGLGSWYPIQSRSPSEVE